MDGAELRAWREEHDLSQAMLGRLLDYDGQQIYRWENGFAKIEHPAMVRLALRALHDDLAAQRD